MTSFTQTSELRLVDRKSFLLIAKLVFLLAAGCGRKTSEPQSNAHPITLQSSAKNSTNRETDTHSRKTKDGLSELNLSYKTRLLSPTSNKDGKLCYRVPSITYWVRGQIKMINMIANSPSISVENDQLELTVVDTAGLNAHLSVGSRIKLSFDNADMPMGSTFEVGEFVYVGLSGEVDLVAVLTPACAEDIVQDVR